MIEKAQMRCKACGTVLSYNIYDVKNIRNFIKKGLCSNCGKFGMMEPFEVDPKQVEELFNEGVSLANLGKYNEAIKCFDTALEIDPKNVYALTYKGISFNNQKEHEEAISWFDKALDIEPNYGYALMSKAIALRFLGSYDEAIKYCDRVLKTGDSFWTGTATYNKSSFFSLKGEKKPALKFLSDAIKLDNKYREKAMRNPDFDAIKNEIEFKKIIES